MASTTTTRYPVKAKSLTLLELCQTISDLRHTSSRNTAQILTRRLYLHPMTISNNAKQHSSKVIANHLIDIEEYNQTLSERKRRSYKQQTYRDLSVLSSSFPLTSRSNTKTHSDRDSSVDFEASLNSISTNSVRLPTIPRKLISSSSKRTKSIRSPFISIERKAKPVPNNDQGERIDVWQHLAHTLERPVPKDPPTTPLDIISDTDLHHLPPTNSHATQMCKRQTHCDSIINEED